MNPHMLETKLMGFLRDAPKQIKSATRAWR
jgi:hypothetical protein